jgi:peroxin-3
LAVVARQAYNIGNGANPPNEYLVAMEQNVQELVSFAAVVYSNNLDLSSSIPNPPATSKSDTGHISAVESSIVDLGQSNISTGPPGGDAGFERAWGKAVDEA